MYSRGVIERTLPSLGAHLITAELFSIIHMPNDPQMGMNTEELLLAPLYDLKSFLESQAYLCAQNMLAPTHVDKHGLQLLSRGSGVPANCCLCVLSPTEVINT